MSRPITFEYQEFKNMTIVALDAHLSDLGFQPVMEDGKLVMKTPERTMKDCRHIDGCVYYHLGHVPDSVMVDLIEKFQKLKAEKGWKKQAGLIVPDHKFDIR